MPITATNPFKDRHFPGEVIILCVRWYLRYPLAYEHVAELIAERGVEVDPSCIWRWVQSYAPELDKRCRTAANGDRASAGFGTIRGTYPARQIQFALKLMF